MLGDELKTDKVKVHPKSKKKPAAKPVEEEEKPLPRPIDEPAPK